MTAGSRLAKSQPTIAAINGMPKRMKHEVTERERSSSDEMPPFSELLRNQPIMAT